MATLSINVPDAKVPGLIAAMESHIEREEGEGARAFAIRYIINHFKEIDYVYRRDHAGDSTLVDDDLAEETP